MDPIITSTRYTGCLLWVNKSMSNPLDMVGILAWQGKGSEPDPRFMALQQFGVQHPETANDPVFKYVDQLYRVAPGVLTEHGKTKSAFAFVVERC